MKYNQELNMDARSVKTPARYDSASGKWVMDTQLTGSNMELYGATVADRPAANMVPIGSVFMAVNTQEMWQSNGTDWVVL